MYAKVFAQMYDGSLCTHGPWEALVTFQQLLVLADQEGTVDMTAEAISRRTTIPLDIIKRGISELMKPDPQSRTPTEEGRRILPLTEGRDWGWLVVNYKHYRQLRREEDRREYHREYWHKRKLKGTQQPQHAQPNQPIAEAKAEALSKPSASHPPAGGIADGFQEFWQAWPKGDRKQDKAKCAEVWKAKGLGKLAETIMMDVRAKRGTEKWSQGFIEAPLVYLRNRRWEDGNTETDANEQAAETERYIASERGREVCRPPADILQRLNAAVKKAPA